MKHKPTCIIYVCTCDVRSDLEKLKDLQEKYKKEVTTLEEALDKEHNDSMKDI